MELATLHYEIEEDVEENRENLLSSIEDNSGESDIVVGPEAATTGLMREKEAMEEYSEPLYGETVTLAQEIVDENGISAIFGIVEQNNNDIYNSCVLLEPDREPEVYRQAEYEHSYDWQTGFGNYTLFNSNHGKIGGALCSDVTRPELHKFWRDEDIDLIAVPANWTGDNLIEEWVDISNGLNTQWRFQMLRAPSR